jgi:hypothetical protein
MTPVQKRKVGIDSNCLTYLIDAMHGVGVEEPVGGQLASQKKALLRAAYTCQTRSMSPKR